MLEMNEKDAYLKDRLLQQNNDALREVIDTYSHDLYAAAAIVLTKQYAQRVQDIEEVVQDTFVFLWRYPEKYNPERASLKTYLSWKVISLAKNKVVKNNREMKLFASLAGLYQHQQIPDWFDDHYLDMFLALPDKAREVMVRRLILNQKPKDIQNALGIPLKEINNILFYYKKRLKDMIREGMDTR